MNNTRRAAVFFALTVAFALPASAYHRWGTYHWAKTGTQANPPVTMNLSGAWPSYASAVMQDWNSSTVINSGWSFGSISSARRCTSTTGQIEVCNSTYGQNGWLGVAGISLSGGHITKGYTKLNDTYYNTPQYNTPAWRQMVFCQEVGHDYGLGHQNEIFTNVNTGSCMDYTNAPQGGTYNGFNYGPANLNPNKHDYDELLVIYNHTENSFGPALDALESSLSVPVVTTEAMLSRAEQWGTPVEFDRQGRPVVFKLNLGADSEGHDHESLTHVFWAPEEPDFEESDDNGRRRVDYLPVLP